GGAGADDAEQLPLALVEALAFRVRGHRDEADEALLHPQRDGHQRAQQPLRLLGVEAQAHRAVLEQGRVTPQLREHLFGIEAPELALLPYVLPDDALALEEASLAVVEPGGDQIAAH